MQPHTRRARTGLAFPALIVATAIGLAGCGGGSGGNSAVGATDTLPSAVAGTPPSREATLVDLASVDELRGRFNADAGQPRLLLLLSPT